VALTLKARRAKNSSLEINYYRSSVKVASFLVFMMTFILIILFFRVIASLFVVLEYSFQSLKKRKFFETEGKKTRPHSSTGHERRKYPRFNVYWPIKYSQTGSSISHNGRVTNLSESGMLIQSPGQVEIGQHLESKLSFILGSEINTIDMQAEVVWRDNYLNKARGDYRCGARFLDISTRDKGKLDNLLMSLSQQSPYSS
jgi:c-di-GMP-binding flagellar brake protein YcgR